MTAFPNAQSTGVSTQPDRRRFLLGAGAAALAAAQGIRPSQAQAAAPQTDHMVRISPVSLELAPG
jgi:hypothetical protein